MNEIIGFAAVIVSIFAGMLFNNSRFGAIDARLDTLQSELNGRINTLQSELNGRINTLQSELNGRMDRMQADLSQFYRDLGRHDAKIEAIEKKAS